MHYVTEGIIASFECTNALKHVMLAKCDLNILFLMTCLATNQIVGDPHKTGQTGFQK